MLKKKIETIIKTGKIKPDIIEKNIEEKDKKKTKKNEEEK